MGKDARSSGIVVRPLTSGDGPALCAAVRSSIASLSYWFPWCHPDYSLADAEERVAYCVEAWARSTEFAFGIFSADGQELLGCTGLNHVDRVYQAADIGYWVGEAYRGRGIAASAAMFAASVGFRELGFVRLQIVVLPNNPASIRVAEKLGATRETEARNRVMFKGEPAAAVVYSLIPADMEGVRAIQL